MERRNGEFRRIALLVEYVGTGYNGWQIQNKGKTVQGELEKALTVLTRERVRITASGRTDSGVHALGQVAHCNISSELPLARICNGLNGILERDIAVKNVYSVPQDFHARYSAVSREYHYLIYNHPQRSPFVEKRALWVPYDLDVEYLRHVSSYLIGERDFRSFCKHKSADGNTVRNIEYITVVKSDNLITLRIRGNAFLHNMVRIIVGTMLELYSTRSDPEKMKTILDGLSRDCSGITSPPHGLYLAEVTYSPGLDTMESAF